MSSEKLIGVLTDKGLQTTKAASGKVYAADVDVVDFVGGPEAHAGALAVIEFVADCARVMRGMRERAGLSPRDLSQAIGVSVSRISQLESGALRHAPSLRTVALYAAACGEKLTLAAVDQGGKASVAEIFEGRAVRAT